MFTFVILCSLPPAGVSGVSVRLTVWVACARARAAPAGRAPRGRLVTRGERGRSLEGRVRSVARLGAAQVEVHGESERMYSTVGRLVYVGGCTLGAPAIVKRGTGKRRQSGA